MIVSRGILPKIKIYFGFLLSILMLGSCETTFEPTGTNFVEIDTTNQPEVMATLSIEDTLGLLIIDDQITLAFNIDIGALTLYEAKVSLDSLSIYTGNTPSDDFYYDPNNYTDGFHILKIEFITSSGTGSLADISMAEGYQFYQEWGVFNIRNSPPNRWPSWMHIPVKANLKSIGRNMIA